MSLMQKAIETYNSYEHKVGVTEGKEPLAPVGHIIAPAKIEIVIDKEGNFKEAHELAEKVEINGKEKTIPKKIIIPVTEKSSGRSGKNPIPHPLCDQVQYLSGSDEKKYNLYVSQLEEWTNECHHEKLEAVLRYVRGGTIISDLTDAGLYDGKKEKNDKDLVAWTVVGTEGDGSVWTDKTLFDSWAAFYRKKKLAEGKQVFSMISGNYGPAAEQHLRGVVPFASTAKLISTNDKGELIYRGERFLDSNEALTISYEDSQKAHNALKWIIANNGVLVGDSQRARMFVCWDPQGLEIERDALFGNNVKEKDLSNYKEDIESTIQKSENKFGDNQHYKNGELVIAAFEAATNGRLAIVYYRELKGSDFMDRTKEWHDSCCWARTTKGNRTIEISPDIRAIVRFAFGTEKEGKVKLGGREYVIHVQRLLSCRLDGTHFPKDIVRALMRNVSSPERYNYKNWSTLLTITCAAIRKYKFDRYKEVWDMALEPEKKDRSYQYGRLLAALEKAESDTYSEEEKKQRQTNAARMWNAFVRNPDRTSDFIYRKIKSAYYKKLDGNWPGRSKYYDKLFNEIREIIAECEGGDHGEPLKETYLFGYSLQMNEFYRKKAKDSDADDADGAAPDNQ